MGEKYWTLLIGVIRNGDTLKRIQCMLEQRQKQKTKSETCELRLNKGPRVILARNEM